ncbi:MAG: hypothetical protein ACRCT2_01795 [Plesiomonas shigelloides]
MRKVLFVPMEACLSEGRRLEGDRFVQAKAAIAFAMSQKWHVYLLESSPWGQGVRDPRPETARYDLPRSRWGIQQGSVKQLINEFADRMAQLQPTGNPIMRGMFCPNQRSDLPTECWKIQFTHRSTLANTHFSIHPGWAALAKGSPHNDAFRLPGAGMARTVLHFLERRDYRVAYCWEGEADRVAAQSIDCPLYSADEWRGGLDPYERSLLVPDKSLHVWYWENLKPEWEANETRYWEYYQR